MNRFKFYRSIMWLVLILFTANPSIFSQEMKPGKERKAEKEAKERMTFDRIDSLVNSRQFVFQEEFNQSSDQVFVVVDSIYGELQYGSRNNLQGSITGFEVRKNEKKMTLSVEIRMRAEMATADVFIFIGSNGFGRVTVKSEFPGNFYFDGSVVDFENAVILPGRSHLVH